MRDLEMKKLFQNLNVQNNTAQFYGQQYATFLQKIYISQIFSDSNSTFQELPYKFLTQNELSLEEQAIYSGKLQIQNLRSGSLLQIQLFGMDSSSDFIKFSQDFVKNGNNSNQIQQELLQYYFKIENIDKSQILLNGETLITSDQYNSTNYQFIFKEVQITSYPQKDTQLLINYQINNKQSLPILVQIHFRNCLVGETVKVFSPNIISCTLCPSGSYLLSAPQISQNNSNNQYVEENSQCQKCPDSAEQCQGSEIILKDGYWRSNINSSEIIFCENNPDNCQSKDNKSINGCILGSIGPLCEECDTQGVVWKNKQFTRSFKEDYTCEQCNTMKYQTIFIISYAFILFYQRLIKLVSENSKQLLANSFLSYIFQNLATSIIHLQLY
ncbi:transmembrane protein (macronuclear) [Tetrahymena thermophila SB210]|uniref:Transmembrane protein n=1 Tax=Tetrahymena thermophila (strain SB210) TaxID=312017 RepID=W7X8Z0_TETTS|nr:transmembrane protein [Tetrahymena thermophila SB210]EWS73807.1 transmembrane protein [Tetrahymena thermophila SB210]|eukprot:XP_012653687.1 transmembrane protein [Tetrahymena thermophila SB210]